MKTNNEIIKGIAQTMRDYGTAVDAVLRHDSRLQAQISRREIAVRLAGFFSSGNPKFDRDQFLKDCNI